MIISVQLIAQDQYVKRTYTTQKIAVQTPIIDGLLNDEAWNSVPWAEEFTVQDPNNGDAPKNQTQFKILYDDQHLYIAYRCFHDEPGKIESRLGRRDNFPGDWIEINIDSYNDNNTAYSFTLSVSGVKGDEFITGNGNNWDSNWNPIWYGKANIDREGWTAEMKIPFSQLRFGFQEEYTWGFNITRRDFGADERSSWQHRPQNVPGFVSNFSDLLGISGIKPKKQVEIQPYITTGVTTSPAEEGNPFEDGTSLRRNIGLDGKIGITSDMTLDFTVNPDFGQVEADPSALNLDGFQIFFDERRPFFIENANLFSQSVSRLEAGGPFGNDNLFYSRRIGSQPSGYVSLPDNSYSSRPDFTSIIGAAKFSGKSKNGWSVGILESITAEEKVSIDLNGSRSAEIIEPLTNYFVGTLSKDLNEGQSILGGSFTAVNRSLSNTDLEDQFHKTAYSGGLNVFHSWKDREWRLRGNFFFSNVAGTPEKIQHTQESFEHYFQRPDANHLSVNNSKSSLSGHGGTLSLGNYGGADNISFQSGLTWRSPGLELNDIGFLNTADQIDFVTWAGYRFPRPFGIFRSFRINYNIYSRWTYNWEHLYYATNFNAHAGFTNYWRMGTGLTWEIKDISTKALFGGPKLRQSAGLAYWMYMQSDERKKIIFGTQIFGFAATGRDKGAVNVRSYSFRVNYQPTDALRLSVSPRYFRQNRVIQNVSFSEFNNEDRYITGRVLQETFNISLRANYSLTPNLTIQYWGQPFISKGNYSEFKYITDPLANQYLGRFSLYDDLQLSTSENKEVYYIDENRDGVIDYDFSNPDFNFLQWRSNLVFRWEYSPSSELFLVWTQSSTNFGDPEKEIFPSLNDDLFDGSSTNTFLFKLTYRFY